MQDGAGLTYQPPGQKVVQRAASDPSTETSGGGDPRTSQRASKHGDGASGTLGAATRVDKL